MGAQPPGITVNGRPLACPGESVVSLLERLGYGRDRPGLAVALNGSVVPRSRWAEQRLAPGDVLDIVGAVQGG